MAKKNNILLDYLKAIFKESEDERGLIIVDTVMKACGFDADEIKNVDKKGLKEVNGIIDKKIKASGGLTDEKLIEKLFTLSQDDLDQLPIEFYAQIVTSDAFKNKEKDDKDKILKKIAKTVGIDVEDLESLNGISPERIAYNSEHYRAIFQAYHAVYNTNEALKNQRVDDIIKDKMQEMVNKAPGLKSDPNKVGDLMNLSTKHKGDLDKAADEVLAAFSDGSVDLSKVVADIASGNGAVVADFAKGSGTTFKKLAKGKAFEESFKNAKAVFAQYELGAFARAAAALGTIQCFEKGNPATSTPAGTRLVTQSDIEKFSIVDPAKDRKPINRFINTAKNVIANFTKPQKLVRLGFRSTATFLVNKGITYFTEAAIPWVGAAVGLVMTISETAIKVKQEKKKPEAMRKTTADIWKEAAPDLARGVITVGGSAIGLGFFSGPIATLASNFVKGIQVAHKEGLTPRHGFFKRVFKEAFSKKNAISLGFSAAGAATGFAVKEAIKEAGGLSGIWDKITSRNKTSVAEETDITSGEESSDNKFFSDFNIEEKLQHQQYKSELKTSDVTDQTYYIDKNGNGHVISNAKYNSDYKMGEYKADLKMGDVKEGLNGEHFVDHNGNLQFGSRKFTPEVETQNSEVKSDNGVYDVDDKYNINGDNTGTEIPSTQVQTQTQNFTGTPDAGGQEELIDPIFQRYPGAQADKNGWLFDPETGRYVTNAEGSLVHLSNPELVKYRAINDDEMLNEAGNIVKRTASDTSTPSNPETITATQTASTSQQRTQAISPEQQKTWQSTQTKTYVEPSSTSVPPFVNGRGMNSKTPYEQALADFAEQKNLLATRAQVIANAQRHIDVIDKRIEDGTATDADIASRNEWENLKNTVENWKSEETNKLEELGAQIESTRPEEVVAQGKTYTQEIDAAVTERVSLENELDALLSNDSSANRAQIKALVAQIAGMEKEIQDRFDYLEENQLIKEGEAYTVEQLKELIPEEPQAVVEEQQGVETSV